MRALNSKIILLILFVAAPTAFPGKGDPAEAASLPVIKPLSPSSATSSASSVSASSTHDATPRLPQATGKKLAIVTAATLLSRPPATRPLFTPAGKELAPSTPRAGSCPSTPLFPPAPCPSPATPFAHAKPVLPFGGSPDANSTRPSKLKTAMTASLITPGRRGPSNKDLIAAYMEILSEIQIREIRTSGRLTQHMFWFEKLVKVLEDARLYAKFTDICSAKMDEKRKPLLDALAEANAREKFEEAREIRLQLSQVNIGRSEIAHELITKHIGMLSPHQLFQYFQVKLGLDAATQVDNSSPYEEIIKNYEDEMSRLGATLVRTPGL